MSSLRNRETLFVLNSAVVLISLIVLVFLEIPSLNHDLEIKFFFDTETYLKRAELFSKLDKFNIYVLYEMAVTNKFGPVLLGYLSNNNYYLIWIFNMIIYIVSSNYIIKSLHLNPAIYHTISLLNCITWISLVSLNKEIFVFPSIAALLYYLDKKSIISFLLLIGFCFLVRWQMALFAIVVAFAFSKFMIFKDKRLLHVLGLLFLISIYLPIFTEDLRYSIEFWTAQAMDRSGGGSGLYQVWINWDMNFLYFISFIFKLIHLTILNFISFLGNPSVVLTRFHNFAETLQSGVFLACYMMIYRRRRKLSLNNDLVYLIFFYFIIFVAVQIYTPRYLYAGYLLITILLSSDLKTKFNNPKTISIA